MRRLLIGMAGFFAWTILAVAAGLPANMPPGEEGKDGEETNVEHFLMEGTEIPGTLEKPHVVYVVPWKEISPAKQDEIPVWRSFKDEILEPVDRDRFQHQYQLGHSPRASKGGHFK